MKNKSNINEVVDKLADVIFADPSYIDFVADHLSRNEKFKKMWDEWVEKQFHDGNIKIEVKVIFKKDEEK